MTKSAESSIDPKLIQGVEIITLQLGNLQHDESVLIISDNETAVIGNYFEKILNAKEYSVTHVTIQPLKSHGESLPKSVSNLMNSSDLIIGLTKNSMAHSKERIESEKFGSRYLSLPDYSEFVLKHPSLRVNFKKLAKNACMCTWHAKVKHVCIDYGPRKSSIESSAYDHMRISKDSSRF